MCKRSGIERLGWMVVVVFLAATVVQAFETARIVTQSKVNVYRDGQLVQVLQENSPLPEGALLEPEGICGVRLQNLNLVAEGGSRFAVVRNGTEVELALDEGMFYFIATASTGRVHLRTPAGVIVVQQFIVRAAADGVVKAVVQVKDGTATLGVLEGGDILVSTVDGERTIRSGEQMTLAQAGAGEAGAAEAGQAKPAVSKGVIAGVAIGAAALAAAALGGGGGSSSSPAPVSPSAP